MKNIYTCHLLGKKLFTLFFISFFTLNMSGCTYSLWHNHNSRSYGVNFNSLDEDKITAFTTVQQKHPQLKKGSLVMIGEKYWYTFSVPVSNALIKFLSADLSKPYKLTSNHVYKDNMPSNTLPLNVIGNGTFRTDYCLDYTLDTDPSIALKDKKILEKLDFFIPGSSKKNDTSPPTYRYCMRFTGKFFQARKDFNVNHAFKNPIPVAIQSKSSYIKSNLGKNITRMLLTPFVVVGDVFLLPIAGAVQELN